MILSFSNMSLRQVLRSRFTGEVKPVSPTTSRKVKDSKATTEPEGVEEFYDLLEECQATSTSSPSPPRPDTPNNEFKDMDEKSVFEVQLTQLQEQLVSVMIENQSLRNELKEENKKQVTHNKIKQLLETEKKKNENLESKVKALDQKKSGSLKLKQKSSDGGHKSKEQNVEPAIDIASELQDEDVVSVPKGEFDYTQVTRKKPISERLFEAVMKRIYDVMDDFSEELEFVHVEDNKESDPLTGKKLKENMKRFGTAAKPYYDTAKGLYNLFSWKNKPYTLIVFLVYMYMVWKGWFLQTLLACLTFRLFVQFLTYRGWNLQFNFIDSGEADEKETDESLGLTDKFNLVIEVATKVQNTLGAAADSLEKIKSLFTWRQPDISNHLFLMIFVCFVISCIFSGSVLFQMMGLMMGIKLFIIENIYTKFPRIKKKYDSTHQMWVSLPTDVLYEKKHMKSEIDRYILTHGHLPDGEEDGREVTSVDLSNDDKTFCQLFSLPTTESPLPGWQGGRMCTLINREKSLAAAFKSGKLYLTRSFMCFERSKTPSPKNLVIPLSNIGSLEKAKPYAWLPGGGMSIEVTLAKSDQSFIFGGLMNRDETYDMISEIGMLSQLPWATGLPIEQLHITRKLSDMNKRIQPQQFKNFSIGMVCDDGDA